MLVTTGEPAARVGLEPSPPANQLPASLAATTTTVLQAFPMSFPQSPLDYERGLNRLIPETEIQDFVDFLLLFSQKMYSIPYS